MSDVKIFFWRQREDRFDWHLGPMYQMGNTNALTHGSRHPEPNQARRYHVILQWTKDQRPAVVEIKSRM